VNRILDARLRGRAPVLQAVAASLRQWTSARSMVMSGEVVIPRWTWKTGSVKNPEGLFHWADLSIRRVKGATLTRRRSGSREVRASGPAHLVRMVEVGRCRRNPKRESEASPTWLHFRLGVEETHPYEMRLPRGRQERSPAPVHAA
jgi:hypothetical protein